MDIQRDFDLAFELNYVDLNWHPGLVRFKVQNGTVQSSIKVKSTGPAQS